MSTGGVAEIAVPIAFFSAIATYWVGALRGAARHERAVREEHARATRAHYAAVEASEDDWSLSPEAVEQSVAEVVALAGSIWHAGSLMGMDGRPEVGLVTSWARSWQSYLGTGLEALGKPSVDLLSVVNRDGEEEDRVVARVRLRIHCKHPNLGSLGRHNVHTDERWTFGRSSGRLVLLAVGGDPLAEPVLTTPLIPNRIADTERLGEESLAELASGQTVGDDVDLSELVSADEPPTLALLDLSVVDGRFLPALIAAGLTHLIEAWEGAATGSEAPLETMASAEAREALLRPVRGRRLFLRDAALKSWEPTKLRLAEHPPAIELVLEVEAVRFVVRDDGAAVAGNETDPHQMDLEWVLELTGSVQTPWKLVTSNCPAAAIPGWT